jgi:hypothetical protein
MKLNEILNKKTQYKVIKSDDYNFTAEAEIGDKKIVFRASEMSMDDYLNNWEVMFNVESEDGDSYSLTGDRNELEVFSMVKDAMMEFMKQAKPNKVVFTTDMENRSSAYERLLKRFKFPGYSFGKTPSDEPGTMDKFTIVKD